MSSIQRKHHRYGHLAIYPCFALAAFSHPGHARAQPAYTVTDISSAVTGAFVPTSLNNTGQVAMSSDNLNDLGYGYVYTQGALDRFGNLGGNAITKTGQINNLGQVVGYSTVFADVYHAFVFNSSTNVMTDLGTFGGSYSYAYGINNLNQIVGQAQTNTSALHAFLDDSTGMHDLGALDGGNEAAALGINDSGEIVGYSYTADGPEQPFVYSNGQMRSLGPLGVWGFADAINNAGLIVGASTFSGQSEINQHAFISDGTTLTDLGTLGGGVSEARGINDQGDVVGSSLLSTGSSAAFLYHDGTMINLNTLIPLAPNGSVYGLADAIDINDAGQILCTSNNQILLLTPVVPSPASLTIAAGLLAGSVFIRRRRSRQAELI